MDGRVAAADVANVALEKLEIDWVKADDGYKEAYVCFGDVGAEVVRVLGGYRPELRFGLV